MIKAKHPNIAYELQDRIIRGDYESKLPGINVLAEEYGVNNRTVIKAITTLEDKGCVKRIPSKGTFVTRLRHQRTNLIGVVMGASDTEASLHNKIIKGINTMAQRSNKSILLGKDHHNHEDVELASTRDLVEERVVDGIVIWPSDNRKNFSPAIKYLIEQKIPFVVVPEQDSKIYGNCHTVSNNDSSGAARMVNHLIDQGFREISFMSDTPFIESIFIKHRYTQYRKTMLKHNLKPEEPIFIPSCYFYPDRDIDHKIMEELTNKDAVFCCTDGIAVKLMRECLRQGIRVPGDLALSGYDNTHLAQAMDLSSIEQHFEIIGEKAVKLLLEEIEGERKNAVHLQVESKLVIRGSSMRRGSR